MGDRTSPHRLPPLSYQYSLSTSADPTSTIATITDTTPSAVGIDNYNPVSPDVQAFQYTQQITQDINSGVNSQLRQNSFQQTNQYFQNQSQPLPTSNLPKLPPLTNHLPLYNSQKDEFDRQVEHIVSPLPQTNSSQDLPQQHLNTYSNPSITYNQSQALAQQQLQFHQQQQQFSQGYPSFQSNTIQQDHSKQEPLQYDPNKVFNTSIYEQQQRLTSPSTLHETSSVLANNDRIPSISLPLPTSKSNYIMDSQQPQYQGNTGIIISPVSVAQSSEAALCVSPVSTSQQTDPITSNSFNVRNTNAAPISVSVAGTISTVPPISVTPNISASLPTDYQPITQIHSSRIDDSLIARIRDFNDGKSIPSGLIRGKSPQIRDTTENLLAGYREPFLQGQGDGFQGIGQGSVTDRPHVCRKCSATFRRRDNLMAHIRAQHKGERPFKCEVCGFRFIKKDHAMKHWKVVHLKERPFVCSECNNRFGQRSDLNKHVRSVHLRIKPFECEHCHLRFSHRGNQIRHQAVVHEKKKPYKCSECHTSFAEKSNLVKHCQALHRNELSLGAQR